MTVIDIGSAATHQAAYAAGPYTIVQYVNPANDTGVLDTFQAYFASGYDGTSCKIGTFSGSGTSWDDRDYETIGTITGGATQTFSGLHCDVTLNDCIGIYFATGRLEQAAYSSGFGYITTEDTFGQGAHTYTTYDMTSSLYGTGATVDNPIPRQNYYPHILAH